MGLVSQVMERETGVVFVVATPFTPAASLIDEVDFSEQAPLLLSGIVFVLMIDGSLAAAFGTAQFLVPS